MDAVDAKKIGVMKKKRDAVFESSTEGLKKLYRIRDFKGDNAHRESVKQLLTYYKKLASKGLQVMIDVTASKRTTQHQVDKYNEVINDYNENGSKLLHEFNTTLQNLLQNNVPAAYEKT